MGMTDLSRGKPDYPEGAKVIILTGKTKEEIETKEIDERPCDLQGLFAVYTAETEMSERTETTLIPDPSGSHASQPPRHDKPEKADTADTQNIPKTA